MDKEKQHPIRLVLLLFVLALVAMCVILPMTMPFRRPPKNATWNEFQDLLTKGSFSRIVVQENDGTMEIYGELRPPSKGYIVTEAPPTALDPSGLKSLRELATQSNTPVEIKGPNFPAPN